jgi:hypothetical protein
LGGCADLSGKVKPEGAKFDFKIKIVRTDLASREYLLGMGGGFGFDGDPVMYQNSSYISKLWFINSYSGGILAKEKIEDMPERYRRFVRFGNPSETQMRKSFIKELVNLKEREQVGQNVFYSRLPSPAGAEDAAGSGSAETAKAGYSEILENFDGLSVFENFREYVEDVLYGEAEPEDAYEDDGDYDDGENYDGDEEIRDILHLNNVYNSEIYKMSKVEYDFNAPGYISLTKDGMFEIKYDETEITGIEDSYVRILFDETNRDILTFHRKNIFEDWFALEKGKRISIERPGADFGMVTSASTKELANTIKLSGGELRMVYTTEINGVPAETVSYRINAKPAAV